ncbi:hypothetical protein N9051_00980 [Akkermansiaceae bacterium]|nr:hypothetical protein [Akkermansiaceae bacterium]
MTRSQFILGVAMLVVAGTLAFTISFTRSEDSTLTSESPSSANSPAESRFSASSARSESRKSYKSATKSSIRKSDPARYDLKLTPDSIAHLSDDEVLQASAIVSKAREKARRKLDSLTVKYNLSNSQRKEIYPLIVAHQPEAHPAMLVGGNFLPGIAVGSTLEESIYPSLDQDQQDTLAENAIDHDAWWKDVVGQLEDDLDQAIDNGEMVEVIDEGLIGVSESDAPAAGDGENTDHSGGNLFDLLKQ